MMNNPQHVKELRDVVHAAIQEWGAKFDTGQVAARDVMTAVAMVIRDVVQGAPDASSRSQLLREIQYALVEQQGRSLILPGHPGWKH